MGAFTRMMMLVTATWALLLGEAYLFFQLIRPLAPNIHESLSSAALKGVAVVSLFVAWVLVMFLLERYLVRRGNAGG